MYSNMHNVSRQSETIHIHNSAKLRVNCNKKLFGVYVTFKKGTKINKIIGYEYTKMTFLKSIYSVREHYMNTHHKK